jgi:hypothetical protein
MLQPLRDTTRFALQAGLVLALLGAVVPVQAAASITTCGFTITTGGIYNVANDLTGCAGDGIDIEASNVTLNLNGHKITGGGANFGIAVFIPGGGQLSTILIDGPGLIQGFGVGILINNVTNGKVGHVTSALNTVYGLVTNTKDTQVTNLVLTNNVFAGNVSFGLLLNNSKNGSIQNNDVSGNGNDGIFVRSGTNNQVQQNIANGNHSNGIAFIAESGSSANNNTTNGNSASGIGKDGGSVGMLFQYNTSEGNGGGDMFDGRASCSSDTWQFNTFFTSNQTCIH